MNPNKINHTYNLGYVLSSGTRIFAFLILIFSLIGFWYSLLNYSSTTFFTSIFTLIISILMLSFKNGVDISIDSNKIREYNSLLGLKYGDWIDYSKFTDVVMLTIRLKAKIGAIGGGISSLSTPILLDLDYQNKQTGVYFMTRTHRKRILLKICKNKAEAEKFSDSISITLSKTKSVFNPQISAQTRNRKRR